MLLAAAVATTGGAHRLFQPSPLHRISSLKVSWRRDSALDTSIVHVRRFRLASRLVREVLLSPDRRLLFCYLT
jgi:hypothetical protein